MKASRSLETTGPGAGTEGFPWQPLFPVPAEIAPDLAGRTSNAAKELLASAAQLCRPRRPAFVAGTASDEELLALAKRCLAWTAEATSTLSDDEQSFDNFFGISRQPSPDGFAVGIVWGAIAMLYELRRPHRLLPSEEASLSAGFLLLAAALEPPPLATRTALPLVDPEPLLGSGIGRWRRGHQMFVALTDGLVFFHRRAIHAIEHGDFGEGGHALGDISVLFSACAAAMHLTGDLPPQDYDEIRRQMSPPCVKAGFSGLFNADHRELLRLTRALAATLDRCPAPLAWERERYWQSLNEVYGTHRWVCKQLVGEASSLSTAVAEGEEPGYRKLESFARRALYFGGFGARPIRPAAPSQGDAHVQ